MQIKKPSAINIKSQNGVALILFFLVILMTGAVFYASNISIDGNMIENETKTTHALAKAKEALIAFAITYQDTSTTDATPVPKQGLMGFLPCPEGANEGSSAGTCGSQYQSAIGRFPWKTLGINSLKDGSGNCLWYAVSSEYKNSGGLDRNALGTATGLSRTEMLNEDSKGSFVIEDQLGNVIRGINPHERVIAIVIAPGKPTANQQRTNNNSQCGGDNDAAHFMEIFNGVDNTVVTLNNDSIDTFIAAEKSNNNVFNDRIITITQQEIFDAIKQRGDFFTWVNNTTQNLAQCVADFGLNNPAVVGGCVVKTCKKQCKDNEKICKKQCKNDEKDCKDQCKLVEDTCLASGGSKKFCNDQRKNCEDTCRAVKSSCDNSCNVTRSACENNCDTNCNGGGGGGNDYRLPWPAAVSLGGFDYRFSENYIEDDVSGNHLGRFPVDISSTETITNNIGGQYLLENNYGACAGLNTDSLTNGTDNFNSPERRIWENWKDHFFYAVASEFDVTAAVPTPNPCPGCLSINGAGNYAAIVFFSGDILNGQIRNTVPDADTKNSITNYLEGRNNINYPDVAGSGDYETGRQQPYLMIPLFV